MLMETRSFLTMRNFVRIVLIGLFFVTLGLSGCGGSSSSSTAPSASVLGFVVNDDDPTPQGDSNQVAAGEIAYLGIYGQNLTPDLDISLGGLYCTVNGLEAYEEEERDSDLDIVYFSCPAQATGNQNLNVSQNGQNIFAATIEVVDAATLAQQKLAYLTSIRPHFDDAIGNGNGVSAQSAHGLDIVISRDIAGKVTADRPDNNTESGGLLYGDKVINFPVRGIVVQLLDPSNKNAVLRTVATDANGNYTIKNVPVGKAYILKANAWLAETRKSGSQTGAQYNFRVEDNTKYKAPDSMLYGIQQSFTLASGDGVYALNLNATLGFDKDGVLLSDSSTRQSGPFSILDVIYNAVDGIKKVDPNISLMDLKIYWSPDNQEVKDKDIDNKMLGNIETSHWSSPPNPYSGLFILGKVDQDTDEFDRGVVGHEFGHYLQYAASYNASLGGSHDKGEFKDPTLAFSEGFGTAIGGLLAKSQYYTDSYGIKQQKGSVVDLQKKTAFNGFYSEESIIYFLYQLGTNSDYGGFSTFWKTLTSMRTGFVTSTVFSFLDRYIAQIPSKSVTIKTAASDLNIRTVDPMGVLPAGAKLDNAVDEDASDGADDLENVYLNLDPAILLDPKTSQNLTPDAKSFCINTKLKSKYKGNILGVSRQFRINSKSSTLVYVNIAKENDTKWSEDNYRLTIRNGKTGKQLSNDTALSWDKSKDVWKLNLEPDTTYTLTVTFEDKPIPTTNYNSCGNKVTLWNVPK